MLQNTSVSNNCIFFCFIKDSYNNLLKFPQTYKAAQQTMIRRNVSLTTNQHIRMMNHEESCDTKDFSNDAENILFKIY